MSEAEANRKSDDEDVNVRMGAACKNVLCQLYGKDALKEQGIKGKTSKNLDHKRRISLLYSKYT